MRKSARRGRDGVGRRRMALALEEGLAGWIYGYRDYCTMRQFYCGYWVNGRQLSDSRQVFWSMLAHLRRVFWACWLIYVGFCGYVHQVCQVCRVFVEVFRHMGPIYVWFVGFLGVWPIFGYGFFVRVAGKDQVAVRLFCFLVHRVSFVRSWHAECQCT